jgi:hypothetical protein
MKRINLRLQRASLPCQIKPITVNDCTKRASGKKKSVRYSSGRLGLRYKGKKWRKSLSTQKLTIE